jgi:ribosomal-protein-alanine N-acetyltransferase
MFDTDRLILREYSPEDFVSLHAILSDPGTMKFWPAPFTEEQTKGWIERSIKSYKASLSPLRLTGFGRWAVILKEDGKQIGDAGIISAEINDKTENDLGYIIHKDFWKLGYGYEAASACMKYGFEKPGIKRMVANMAFNNVASVRVAEKIGMKKETEFLNNRNRNILTFLYSAEK